MVLGRRVDYLSPTLYGTDVLIVLLLLFWLLAKVYRDWYVVSGKRKKFVFPHLPDTKTQILILFVFVNITVAASRPVAIYTWIKFFEFFLLGFYIVKTKPKFEPVVFFLSASVLYSSLIAITQFFLQHSIGGVLWFLGERAFTSFTPGIAQIPLCLPWTSGCPLRLRAYGTFPHPNVLGGYIATLLPLFMYQSTKLQSYKFGKQQFLTWFYGVTIIVGTIALIFTFSRSAWAAGVLGIGIWYIVSGNSHLASRVLTQIRNTKFQIFFPLLLFVGIIISVIVPQFLGDSESVVVRNQLNVSAISLIRQSPLLGVGLGNFLVTLPDVLPSRMIYFLQPVHNIYLLLFSEVGLTGSIILGWLLLLLVKNYGKKQHSLLIFYSFMLILLLGFTDHYPITLQQGRLLFTLLFALVLQ
jgi:hypothetical protein